MRTYLDFSPVGFIEETSLDWQAAVLGINDDGHVTS